MSLAVASCGVLPTPEEAKQVFASRRLIEPGIAAQACEKIEEADLLHFEDQLASESRFLAQRGPEARRSEIKASGDFHLLLATVVANPILLRFMEELVARSSLVIALYGRSGVSACGHSEHLEIWDALQARDAPMVSSLIILAAGNKRALSAFRAQANPSQGKI